jgi:hypothetical protein
MHWFSTPRIQRALRKNIELLSRQQCVFRLYGHVKNGGENIFKYDELFWKCIALLYISMLQREELKKVCYLTRRTALGIHIFILTYLTFLYRGVKNEGKYTYSIL